MGPGTKGSCTSIVSLVPLAPSTGMIAVVVMVYFSVSVPGQELEHGPKVSCCAVPMVLNVAAPRDSVNGPVGGATAKDVSSCTVQLVDRKFEVKLLNTGVLRRICSGGSRASDSSTNTVSVPGVDGCATITLLNNALKPDGNGVKSTPSTEIEVNAPYVRPVIPADPCPVATVVIAPPFTPAQ